MSCILLGLCICRSFQRFWLLVYGGSCCSPLYHRSRSRPMCSFHCVSSSRLFYPSVHVSFYRFSSFLSRGFWLFSNLALLSFYPSTFLQVALPSRSHPIFQAVKGRFISVYGEFRVRGSLKLVVSNTRLRSHECEIERKKKNLKSVNHSSSLVTSSVQFLQRGSQKHTKPHMVIIQANAGIVVMFLPGSSS